MKRNYQTPTLCVVKLQHFNNIMQLTSSVKSISSNAAGLDYGGASSAENVGSINARVKGESYNVWDDDWKD